LKIYNLFSDKASFIGLMRQIDWYFYGKYTEGEKENE